MNPHSAHAAATNLDLIGFLTLGLLGGFAHCVGMCSPFVLMVSRRYSTGVRPGGVAHAWYTVGRLTTYTLLGAIAGGMGMALTSAGALLGIQRAAAFVSGAVLVVWAVAVLLQRGRRATSFGWFTRMTTRLGAQMPGHPVVLGLVLGLLPCGLLYSAVVAAMARGTVVGGAIAMGVFGLGTVPALFMVSLADTLLIRRRPALNLVSQVFVLSMGVWFLWRAF
jgi:sulfite exporter TauE/SafE